MARTPWPALAVVAAGAGLGYAIERHFLHGRLAVPPSVGPELGSIGGETVHLDGPEGVVVAVESYGPVDAPQIVFAHGWCCTGRVWHEQVLALADRYRLVTYDQPGHGRTSRPATDTYTVDLLGDTLAAVIRGATRPGPIVLVGHSLGGMTLFNVSRRHPELFAERVHSVVLLSTTSRANVPDVPLGIGVQTAARIELAVSRLLGRVDRRVLGFTKAAYRASSDLSFLITKYLGLSRGATAAHVDFTEQLVLDSSMRMIVGLTPPVLQLDEDDGLDCLTVPTTIAVGTADRLTPPGLSRRMAARCRHAELVELAGIGHMSQLEAHAAVNAVIDRHGAMLAEALTEVA